MLYSIYCGGVLCGVSVSFNMGMCGCVSTFKVSVSFIMCVCRCLFHFVGVSVVVGYNVQECEGDVGIQGVAGLIRKIPDSGGVPCCLVGLCGIGQGVCDVSVVVCLVYVCMSIHSG